MVKTTKPPNSNEGTDATPAPDDEAVEAVPEADLEDELTTVVETTEVTETGVEEEEKEEVEAEVTEPEEAEETEDEIEAVTPEAEPVLLPPSDIVTTDDEPVDEPVEEAPDPGPFPNTPVAVCVTDPPVATPETNGILEALDGISTTLLDSLSNFVVAIPI